MSRNIQQNSNVIYLTIDSESNYFNTKEQLAIRNERRFFDKSLPGLVSGSNRVGGLFSGNRIVKDAVVYNSPVYPTGSTAIDSSGSPRKILDSNIDFFASSSIDYYRNGVEITRETQWTTGLAKITAGEPGHLVDDTLFGVPDFSIVDKDYYQELEYFNPVKFIETGGDPSKFTYPIIVSDNNQAENIVLDGVIEPFDIRPVISNLSINFPFEPRAFRGDLSLGNLNTRFASDRVLSVDYFLPGRKNNTVFLDDSDVVGIISYSDTGLLASASLGSYPGFYDTRENIMPFFEDVMYPRGTAPGIDYGSELTTAVNKFGPLETTYLTSKEFSATCGFVYGDTTQGVDSVVYGDKYYGSNRDNRRSKRTITSLRDAETFIPSSGTFNDTNTINFVTQSIEYPSMLPSIYSGSMMNDTVRSEVYKQGSITVTRVANPTLYDKILSDSVINSKKRLGI